MEAIRLNAENHEATSSPESILIQAAPRSCARRRSYSNHFLMLQELDPHVEDLVLSYLNSSELLCTLSRVSKALSAVAHRNVRHIRLKRCVPTGTLSNTLGLCCRLQTLEVAEHISPRSYETTHLSQYNVIVFCVWASALTDL
jgi:hypothetical protein